MNRQLGEKEILLAFQPSQWTNLGGYLLLIFTMIVYFPLGALISLATNKYIEVQTWKYTCHTKGIEERKGVFNVTQEEV